MEKHPPHRQDHSPCRITTIQICDGRIPVLIERRESGYAVRIHGVIVGIGDRLTTALADAAHQLDDVASSLRAITSPEESSRL